MVTSGLSSRPLYAACDISGFRKVFRYDVSTDVEYRVLLTMFVLSSSSSYSVYLC